MRLRKNGACQTGGTPDQVGAMVMRSFVALNGSECEDFNQGPAYVVQQNAGSLRDTGALVAKLCGSDLPTSDQIENHQ